MAKTDYRQSGVDIDAGNEAVRRIKELARGTYTRGVLSGVGSFGGLFALETSDGADGPVLVASADGVGTKLKLAFMTGVDDTVGRELVNHCVNVSLVRGAKALCCRESGRSADCSRSRRRMAPTVRCWSRAPTASAPSSSLRS
jgi:phosphoribosylaminoimidazole (AIR) synthetase